MPPKQPWYGRKSYKFRICESKQSDYRGLLVTVLGMRMAPQKVSSSLWQPLKQFAYSQLTSLVRRATLKESERIPKYEKVHNFKVRM